MDEFMEKKEWDVFFEVINLNITASMKKHSERYRKLNEEKHLIYENHPEYGVLYDYGMENENGGLNLSDKAVKDLARLIQIESELFYMIQEMYFFSGIREGIEIYELTRECK